MRIWWYWLNHDDEVMKFINFLQYHLISSSFLVLLVSLMITDHCHGVMLKFQTQKTSIAGMSPGVFAAETGRREEVYAGGSIVWNTRGPDQRAKGDGRCPQCPMVQKPHPGEAGGATGGISWGTLDVESYQVFLEIEVRSYELPILLLIDLNHSDDAPEQRSKKDTAFSVSRPCNLQWL